MRFRPSHPFAQRSFRALVGAFAFAASAIPLVAQGIGQSTLPATTPTNAGPAPISATPLNNSVGTTQPHGAEITFSGGLLGVRANDSSLNQILRSISQATGMKIVGGVAEERVFGNYGPAAPATVLATLLDGTGSNMLLRETATDAPAELVLTPRTAGATPPNPFASAERDREQPAPAPNRPPPQTAMPQRGLTFPQQTNTQQTNRSSPQPLNNVNGNPANSSPTASTFPVTNSVPADSVPTPSTTPPPSGIVDSPPPPPPGSGLQNTTGTNPPDSNGTNSQGTTTTTSPNGAKTPEQIYQQLQQLMQRGQTGQQQTNPNTQTAPSSTSPQ